MPKKLLENGHPGLSSPTAQEYLAFSLPCLFSCGRRDAGWRKGKGGKPESLPGLEALAEPDSKSRAFPFRLEQEQNQRPGKT